MAIKGICDDFKPVDGTYNSSGEQKVIEAYYCYNTETRQIVAFNKKTGDLITAGKYRSGAFNRFVDTMDLGIL
jgi:hypothetical protein